MQYFGPNTLINRYKWLIFALLIGLIGWLGYYLIASRQMPDVVFTTIQGEKIPASALRGKVVLVNFWASDCLSCVQEMPQIVQTYQAFKSKGFVVIAIAMPYDPPAQTLNYVRQKKLPFYVMHDGFATMTAQFGQIAVTPTTFVYDKQGKELQRIVGTIDFKQLNTLLQKALS